MLRAFGLFHMTAFANEFVTHLPSSIMYKQIKNKISAEAI